MFSSLRRSLPKAKTVHGITVTKRSMGDYIEAMEELNNLPSRILELAFPEMEAGEIMDVLRAPSREDLSLILLNVLTNTPEFAINLLAQIGGMDDERLKRLSPSEFLDVALAWWELNDLTDFFRKVWAPIEKAIRRTQTELTGSSVG